MTSKGHLPAQGVMIAMNVFVDPANVEKFLELYSDCAKRFLAEPECTLCEFLQDSENPGNIRIVQGWSKDKEWFYDTHMPQEWFKSFPEKVEKYYIKPRQIQFFNRVAWKNV